MLAQGSDCVIIAGKFGLSQCGMDFIVTDLVQEHRRPAFAAPEFWHEVMLALADIGRDGTAAERAVGRV